MSSRSPLDPIWKDQAEFNQHFFPPSGTFEEQSRQTKEFVLCIMSELDELLRAIKWKSHRRTNVKPNVDQIRNELTDIWKYLISLALVWKVSPEDMLRDYWRKSMVCRQRYSEEFIQELTGSIVICDIDGVLADYYVGLLRWIAQKYPTLETRALAWVKNSGEMRPWLNAEHLGVDEQRWQEIKHDFRVSRGKVGLPCYPDSSRLLTRVKADGHKVVLLTSRPIEEYPNVYTDTLEWLHLHHIPFDFIWWSKDKGEKILEKGIRSLVQYVVDDDLNYARQMAKLGLKVYYVNQEVPSESGWGSSGVLHVHSLKQLMEVEYGNQ